MTESVEADEHRVAWFVVMGAYGEIMLRFQLLELSYSSILAMRLKNGTTLDQGMAKVAGWDSQTGGRLVGVLGLPDDLKIEGHKAVNTRNHLAHRFLRDRAPYLHDANFCDHVASELAQVAARLDEFEERLDAYKENLGIVDLTDEELKEMGLAEPPDPAEWFFPAHGSNP